MSGCELSSSCVCSKHSQQLNCLLGSLYLGFFIVVVVVVVVGDPFASFFAHSGYKPFGICNLQVFPRLLLGHLSLR